MAGCIGVLYREELRALARGRFAWLGAAVVLLAVGGLAAAGTQDTWLDGYGIIAYGLVPLAFIPVAAALLASPRANRFVESVFTSPVRRSDWLCAKFLVLLTLAALYYVALLPMMVVYVAHVGLPPLLGKLLLWAPGLLLAAVAVGTLIGVLFIGDSLAAPVGAGMGVLLAYVGLLPLQELMVARGNGATHTGHITLISPAVLMKNALGFALATASVPATHGMTWLSFAVLVGGSLALAAWVFLKVQGVETWEAGRGQRWAIAIGLLILLIFPAVFANTNYDAAAPRANRAPAVRAAFGRSGAGAALVENGRPLPRRCCSTILNRDAWPPLPTDRATPRDLLILLPVEANLHVRRLEVELAGGGGLDAVTADAAAAGQNDPQLETRPAVAGAFFGAAALPADAGPQWMVRIPVSLTPTHPWDIGGDVYPLGITVTYWVTGEAQSHRLNLRAAVAAQVPNAIYEMSAAALIFPLLCLAAAFRRWRRTR